MIKLQVIRGSKQALRRACAMACCMDNEYGKCTSQPYSPKPCSEPCGSFVQVMTNCARCASCKCAS